MSIGTLFYYDDLVNKMIDGTVKINDFKKLSCSDSVCETLAMIALEKKRYDIYKYLNNMDDKSLKEIVELFPDLTLEDDYDDIFSKINTVRREDAFYNLYRYIELYNDENREKFKLKCLKTTEYDFHLQDRFKYDSWVGFTEINYVKYFLHPLYHMIKNKCYDAVNLYLEKSTIFIDDNDIFGTFVLLAVKNRDLKTVSIFYENGFRLNSTALAYLYMTDNEYMIKSVFPIICPDKTEEFTDAEFKEFYMKTYDDTQRFQSYILLAENREIPFEKRVYMHDNLLDIKEITLSNADIFYYSGYMKKELVIDSNVCSKRLKVHIDGINFNMPSLRKMLKYFISADVAIELVFKYKENSNSDWNMFLDCLFTNKISLVYDITIDGLKPKDFVEFFDLEKDTLVKRLIKSNIINSENCEEIIREYEKADKKVSWMVLQLRNEEGSSGE